MHEYSVASELVHALLPTVEAIDGRVVSVFLKKGELRILSDTALRNAFEILAEGTELAGARLEIESIPVRVTCPSCGYAGPVERLSDPAFHFAVPILSCPSCEAEVEIQTGRELYVDRLSVQAAAPEST